jgi:ribosomal protein S18 acetylase RimI-like enzyme
MNKPYEIIQIGQDNADAVSDLFHFFKRQREKLPHPHWMMDRTIDDFHALVFDRDHDDARIWVAETGRDLELSPIRGMIVLRRGSVIASPLDADDSYTQKTNNTLKTAFKAAAKHHTIGLIECLLVDSAYHQNGVARGLITAATNHAKQDPRITFIAANIVQDNTQSIETFEKSGFHIFAQNTRDDDAKTPRYVAGLDLSA